MSYYWLFFPALIIFFPIFMILWTDSRFRYWRIWTPIRRVHDFFWNLKNSEGNYGHWVHSSMFGGHCVRCGSLAHGGMRITILGTSNLGAVFITCEDVRMQEAMKEIMEE